MKGPSSALRFVSADRIRDRVQETHEAVARRAFEIFQGSAYEPGRDLEHWFHAEADVVHPVTLELAEQDEVVTVRAELPGFTAKDIELAVEPRRITISGTRPQSAGRRMAKRAAALSGARVLQIVDLPIEVDTGSVRATLRGGVLALEVQKAGRVGNGRESR